MEDSQVEEQAEARDVESTQPKRTRKAPAWYNEYVNIDMAMAGRQNGE